MKREDADRLKAENDSLRKQLGEATAKLATSEVHIQELVQQQKDILARLKKLLGN